MTEDQQNRWVVLLRMWRDAVQSDSQLFCTKRFQWIGNGFHSGFCEECWRIAAFEYYWSYGLGKYRFWCIADNCVNEVIMESVLQEHPDWRKLIWIRKN